MSSSEPVPRPVPEDPATVPDPALPESQPPPPSRGIPIAVGIVLIALIVWLVSYTISRGGTEGNLRPGEPSRNTGGSAPGPAPDGGGAHR